MEGALDVERAAEKRKRRQVAWRITPATKRACSRPRAEDGGPVERAVWRKRRQVTWRITPARPSAGCFGLGERRCVSTSWARPTSRRRACTRGYAAKRGSPRAMYGRPSRPGKGGETREKPSSRRGRGPRRRRRPPRSTRPRLRFGRDRGYDLDATAATNWTRPRLRFGCDRGYEILATDKKRADPTVRPCFGASEFRTSKISPTTRNRPADLATKPSCAIG